MLFVLFHYITPAVPNLFRLADHFINAFRFPDHNVTFPIKIFQLSPTEFFYDFHFWLISILSVISVVFVLPSHSFLLTCMRNQKHFTNIKLFNFTHETFFYLFWALLADPQPEVRGPPVICGPQVGNCCIIRP